MATYERETFVDAPLSVVWRFHSKADGLRALTPDWLGLDVIEVRGPHGDPNPEELVVGSEIDIRMRPFGRLPGGEWTSKITERAYDGESAMFRDVMVEGPFARWVHTHQFAAERGGTRLRDTVSYELPPGGLGRRLSPFGVVGFEPMFRHRHRTTKELLE
ncbi:SRPBCC family protein [Natronorarus salvus]|uniref:SRPBCC family protein n=1 Tax=Natronorarus salvus TaxID=3117733 RepID=UPI002F266BD7